jgi:dolichol-phosphate mannosyltransferase
MNVAILIPTYNEKDNISKLLPEIQLVAARNRDITIHVFVIDDSSPDGTLDAVKLLEQGVRSENFHIIPVSRAKKEGLGKAYIYAFNKLLNSKVQYKYALQMDADLSHNPIYIDDFLRFARDGFEFVVGSRYIDGGGIPDWGLHRRLLSKFGNLYARIMLGNKISDYTGGFNMYSMSLLRKLNFDLIDESGYGFLIALKFSVLKLTNKVGQVPIIFIDRTMGDSKMPLNTLVKNFKLVFDLKFKK